MKVYYGSMPSLLNFIPNEEKYPNVWNVDITKKPAKDGLYFAVEANTLGPHNSRKHSILKRVDLEKIHEECQMALYYRDLLYRGVIPCERENLEHALRRIPLLLESDIQRFKVHK